MVEKKINFKDILMYINNKNKECFSLSAYHRLTGIPRMTIKDALDTLITKGLIEHPCYGSYLITKKGKLVLSNLFSKKKIHTKKMLEK